MSRDDCKGRYYEVAIVLGRGEGEGADERLRAALHAVWSPSDLAAYYAGYADALLEWGLVSPDQHARIHDLVGNEETRPISARSILEKA